jgi:hypothetical protein
MVIGLLLWCWFVRKERKTSTPSSVGLKSSPSTASAVVEQAYVDAQSRTFVRKGREFHTRRDRVFEDRLCSFHLLGLCLPVTIHYRYPYSKDTWIVTPKTKGCREVGSCLRPLSATSLVPLSAKIRNHLVLAKKHDGYWILKIGISPIRGLLQLNPFTAKVNHSGVHTFEHFPPSLSIVLGFSLTVFGFCLISAFCCRLQSFRALFLRYRFAVFLSHCCA